MAEMQEALNNIREEEKEVQLDPHFQISSIDAEYADYLGRAKKCYAQYKNKVRMALEVRWREGRGEREERREGRERLRGERRGLICFAGG